MKKKAKLFGAYLPILLILLPIAVALRTIACFYELNDGGYFDNKTAIIIANAITIVLVALSLSYLLVARKDTKLVYRPEAALNFVSCAIICTALVFVAINAIFSATPGIKEYFGRQPDDRYIKMLIYPLAILFTGITALASVPYFVTSAVWAKGRSVLLSNLGLLPLVFICLMVATVYFDTSAALNMPGKVVSLMAYLSAAVFFLYEIRLPLGREKWRAYICFGMICTVLCAYSSIPSLIVFVFDPTAMPKLATSEFELVMTFAIFVFATLKLILAATLNEDRESVVAQKVRAYALARAEALEPKEPETEETAETESNVQEAEEIAEDVQIANQESFFEENAEQQGDTVAEEIPIEDAGLMAELGEISEERRLELSAELEKASEERQPEPIANIETTAEEGEKEADNQ